jgi:hypothetical protein
MAGLMIMPACYKQPIINIPEIKLTSETIKKGIDLTSIFNSAIFCFSLYVNYQRYNYERNRDISLYGADFSKGAFKVVKMNSQETEVKA